MRTGAPLNLLRIRDFQILVFATLKTMMKNIGVRQFMADEYETLVEVFDTVVQTIDLVFVGEERVGLSEEKLLLHLPESTRQLGHRVNAGLHIAKIRQHSNIHSVLHCAPHPKPRDIVLHQDAQPRRSQCFSHRARFLTLQDT